MSQTILDLHPIVDQIVLPLLEPVVGAIAAWALIKVAGFAHIQIQDSQRAVLEQAIANGLNYVDQKLAGKEQVTVDDRVAGVVNYVAPKIPGALASLGITGPHLADLVTARLPK